MKSKAEYSKGKTGLGQGLRGKVFSICERMREQKL